MNKRKFWYKWKNLHAGYQILICSFSSWLLAPTNIIFPKRTVLVFTESWSRDQFSTWLLSILFLLFQLAYQILIIIKNVEAAGWKYKRHERFSGKNLPSDEKYFYTMTASKLGNDSYGCSWQLRSLGTIHQVSFKSSPSLVSVIPEIVFRFS